MTEFIRIKGVIIRKNQIQGVEGLDEMEANEDKDQYKAAEDELEFPEWHNCFKCNCAASNIFSPFGKRFWDDFSYAFALCDECKKQLNEEITILRKKYHLNEIMFSFYLHVLSSDRLLERKKEKEE